MTSIDEVFNPKLTRKEFLEWAKPVLEALKQHEEHVNAVVESVLDALKQHEARLNALEKKERMPPV